MIIHDLLIVISGLARMRAVLEAGKNVDVAEISKVHPLCSHSEAALVGIAAVLDGRAKKIGDFQGYNRYTRLPSRSIMITSWSCHALRWDLPNPGTVNTDSSVRFSPGCSPASSSRCCSSLEINT